MERTRICPMSEGAERKPSSRVVSGLGRIVSGAVSLTVSKLQSLSRATQGMGDAVFSSIGDMSRVNTIPGETFVGRLDTNLDTQKFQCEMADNPLQTPVD